MSVKRNSTEQILNYEQKPNRLLSDLINLEEKKFLLKIIKKL